jgi:HK97 family phage major capsid protein
MSDHENLIAELKAATKTVEDQNKAFLELKATNDELRKSLEEKGSADVLVKEKLDRINADMTKSQEVLDNLQLAMKRRDRVSVDANGREIDLDKKALDWARSMDKKNQRSTTEGYTAKDLAEYKAAFDRWSRKGESALSAAEVKALAVGSDPDGGYTVHPDMSGAIVAKIFDTSPMRAYASVQTISTDSLVGYWDDDEAAANWESETSTTANTDTPEIGRWSIPVHNLRAAPRASQNVLDDSAWSLEQWLINKVADKFGRSEATAFVTGAGVDRPRGFTTYTDGTSIREQVEQVDTGVNGDFPAAPAGGDTLISALYKLKPQYRARASWFMNRLTMSGARLEKDSNGAYIWSPGIAAGQPATLLGYPVAPSFEDMADYTTTGALAIAVGDMGSAYQIVERAGMQVLRDPFSAKPRVEFYCTKRVGGGLINGEAIKLIAFKA